MYDTYMSTPGNTAKLGTAHSNIQTAQRGPSLVGSEPTMHWSSYLPSQHSNPLCQPGIKKSLWLQVHSTDFTTAAMHVMSRTRKLQLHGRTSALQLLLYVEEKIELGEIYLPGSAYF